MNYFKLTLLGLLLILTSSIEKTQAQNLLNMEGWTTGQGSTGIFNAEGAATSNIREWGIGPNGKQAILWKGVPDATPTVDGGWHTPNIPINNTNMYRFTVWLKKTNSSTGDSHYGSSDNVRDLNGTPHSNPYFWRGDLPELNKWYLLVGYIHGIGDTSQIHLGGIYDGVTGSKVIVCSDYKWMESAINTFHHAFIYDTNMDDRQYFYAPRIDVINGNEPSVETLLNLSGITPAIAYFPGKVGIQTPNPGNYSLAVNGNIRAKEVKVETGWSDFVFEKNYPLLSLKEVETFISNNKHLPDVPSEKEVAKDGINLGTINSKLLQKVEELTLYIIQMNKELKMLKAENDKLSKTP